MTGGGILLKRNVLRSSEKVEKVKKKSHFFNDLPMRFDFFGRLRKSRKKSNSREKIEIGWQGGEFPEREMFWDIPEKLNNQKKNLIF